MKKTIDILFYIICIATVCAVFVCAKADYNWMCKHNQVHVRDAGK